MSSNNVSKSTNFFTRVGNWLNQNGGKLGTAMQIGGTTAMGVGMTAMVIHDMKHYQGSIFGGCCNPYINPMMGMNPMMYNMGCMNPMMGMTGSIFPGCNVQAAMMTGYQQGAMMAAQISANPMGSFGSFNFANPSTNYTLTSNGSGANSSSSGKSGKPEWMSDEDYSNFNTTIAAYKDRYNIIQDPAGKQFKAVPKSGSGSRVITGKTLAELTSNLDKAIGETTTS